MDKNKKEALPGGSAFLMLNLRKYEIYCGTSEGKVS